MLSVEKTVLSAMSRAIPGYGPFRAGAVAAALVSVFDIPPFRPEPARKAASQAGDGFASGTSAKLLRSWMG